VREEMGLQKFLSLVDAEVEEEDDGTDAEQSH
jgi:hypothetical protein